MFIYNSKIGSFAFDLDTENKLIMIDSAKTEEDLLKKHECSIANDLQKDLARDYFLENFENYAKDYRNAGFKETSRILKSSVNPDNFIIQTASTIMELDKISNMLSRRLDEYYGLYLPELMPNVKDNKRFALLVSSKSKKELMNDLKISKTIGADMHDNDVEPMIDLAKQINDLFNLRDKYEAYLNNVLKTHMPNVHSLLGTMITAKLLVNAGSLLRLSRFPASTVQTLGAETALFRHLKTGARCPKYGHLFNHPYIAKSKPRQRGKVARMLADKTSILAKIDYFKGEFKGDEIKAALEKKIDIINKD